jgi:hypothetical protein
MTLQTPARTQQLTLREVLNKLEIPFYEMDVIWDYKARKRSQVWWVNLCLHLLLLGAAVCLAVLSSVSGSCLTCRH